MLVQTRDMTARISQNVIPVVHVVGLSKCDQSSSTKLNMAVRQ